MSDAIFQLSNKWLKFISQFDCHFSVRLKFWIHQLLNSSFVWHVETTYLTTYLIKNHWFFNSHAFQFEILLFLFKNFLLFFILLFNCLHLVLKVSDVYIFASLWVWDETRSLGPTGLLLCFVNIFGLHVFPY